uniref:Uncharacterized protein n=1 Tax=Setaria digitata TaxID=48799 RepID=A0A915PVQ1_9BILA
MRCDIYFAYLRHDSFGFGLSENSISADSSSGPRFRDNKSTRKDQDSSQSSSSLPESTDGLFGNSFGSLQTTGKNGIETLLNTFLGPSFFGRTTLPPATNLANFFNPEYYQSENYLSTGASNIDRLINTLKRSGARRMSPDLNSSPNLLQTIFGKR